MGESVSEGKRPEGIIEYEVRQNLFKESILVTACLRSSLTHSYLRTWAFPL